MEKTTKKQKKTKKSLRKRIGLIAIGGLSVALTVCLSVGATLAWFAGSTWSSNTMYMGGPVYVEMAGRGAAENTRGDGEATAKWQGGTGNLDIKATAARDTGTVGTMANNTNILLPGQKFEIYSQARVFSTAETTSVGTADPANQSSGANLYNTTSGNGTVNRTSNGRVTTTTSSVLRARFSVDIEFDPSVGFNNFTDDGYMRSYPVQSQVYTGAYATSESAALPDNHPTTGEGSGPNLSWQDALNAAIYSVTRTTSNENGGGASTETATATYTDGGRRDAVTGTTYTSVTTAMTESTASGQNMADMAKIFTGAKKSIYKWKYVSYNEYVKAQPTSAFTDANTTGLTLAANDTPYVRMGAPFDGNWNSNLTRSNVTVTENGASVTSERNVTGSGNGFYGVWVLREDTSKYYTTESDGFYKERCLAYLQTYVEEYRNEYGNVVTRTLGSSIHALDNQLNQSFVDLVNDSSDAIHTGNVNGMTVNNGNMTYVAEAEGRNALHPTNASWLYIDPAIGNDTNTDELSTSTGGWWYLVADNGGQVSTYNKDSSSPLYNKYDDTAQNDLIAVAYDSWYTLDSINPSEQGFNASAGLVTTTPTDTTGNVKSSYATYANVGGTLTGSTALSVAPDVTTPYGTKYHITRAATNTEGTRGLRLYAQLFEIDPLTYFDGTTGNPTIETIGLNNGDVVKVVSYAFPFVNGTAVLPGDALTNVFANAKLTFKISFQALQAFLPYSQSIDNITYKSPLLGTAKALNIKNAIPVFNEAFDYQEDVSTGSAMQGL